MNYFDLFFCLILVIGLYRGFSKGFIIQLATLIGLGGGVYGAIKFSDWVSVWAKNEMGWKTHYLPLISFLLVFVGVFLIVYFMAKLLEGIIKIAALGILNRLAGAIFGGIKYIFIASILLFLLDFIDIKNESYRKQKEKSFFYSSIHKIAPTIVPAIKKSIITRSL